jgi:AMP deaminase
VEEYSVAAQVWKLSATDICEVARNSVLQSGFEHPFKRQWLGPNYMEDGNKGNDITMANVPDIRVGFRHDMLVEEKGFLAQVTEDKAQ